MRSRQKPQASYPHAGTSAGMSRSRNDESADSDNRRPRQDQHQLETVLDDVRVQFEKKFHFRPILEEAPRRDLLPPLDTLYRCPEYTVPSLQEQKSHLNAVKNRLNDFEISEWHQHTRHRSSLLPILNELRYRVKGEFVTQAFAKLYECLAAYELVDTEANHLYSVHLCEAPGAFVTALNHYIRLNCRPRTGWDWFACTLNPYYEGNCPGFMIPDDRFILHTLDNWCFGVDATGDILVRENRAAIIERSRQWPMVHLVTADGSIDCLDVPEEQEERVSVLHLAETIIALSVLSIGGHFVLKMFTLFEHSSVNLLFLLHHCFEELHVFKPCTSKPGNSEVYLIAKRYRRPTGIDEYLDRIYDQLLLNDANEPRYTLFDPATIPAAFLEQVTACATQFVRWQADVIESNIRFYGTTDPREDERLIEFKKTIAAMFFERYRITPIRAAERIVRGINVASGTNLNQKESHGTYNERRVRGSTLNVLESLQALRDRLDHITLTRQTINPDAQFDDMPSRKRGPPYGLTVLQELALTVGKPVMRVKNSKFALLSHLRLLNEAIDLYQSVIVDEGAMQRQGKNILRVEANGTITVDMLAYASISSFDRFEKQLFHTIVCKILHFVHATGATPNGTPTQLILENWLALTQFSVGLLYLLKLYVFESIEPLSLTRLALRRLRPDAVTNLLTLNDAFSSCVASTLSGATKAILTLVPITSLLDGDFQYAVLNYNNSLCLIYCSRLLDAVEKAHMAK
uniref:Cap-specific mRNA (nucleoside-2'-O-)-methyltransferase 2 n=1 Tax=Anopheles triannulatus TaxID=58253 RepID=A0A2M4AM29_9DIPT